MKNFQVLALCVLAACTYGVIHDQITVRVCIEYFTVAHPPLFHTTSPTVLALCWGVAATAGIGAALGLVLVLVSQSPGAASYSISRLARSILFLLAVMTVSAATAGIAGYQLSRKGFISIPDGLGAVIPMDHHDRFMAVWFAHGASYIVGLTGGALLCFRIWLIRGRPSGISVLPQTRAAAIRTVFLALAVLLVIWFRFHAR